MIDVLDLCHAAFNHNFRFEGVTARRVAVLVCYDDVAVSSRTSRPDHACRSMSPSRIAPAAKMSQLLFNMLLGLMHACAVANP